MTTRLDPRRPPLLRLLLLAITAVLVEGYHFGVDDGAIYIPAVEHAANPHLFPFGSEFFLSHASLSVFAPTVGAAARLLHLPIDGVVLFWHVACCAALLAVARVIATELFQTASGRWGAVITLAATLPVPVAGTALFMSDNYLSARSFSSPCGLLAVALFLRERRAWAVAALALTALFHPLMSAYCAALLGVLWWMRPVPAGNVRNPKRLPADRTVTAALSCVGTLFTPHAPLSLGFEPASGAYRAVLYSRTYFFARQWAPYEWLGVAAPLVILAVLGFSRKSGVSLMVARLSRALLLLGVAATAAFLIVSASSRLDMFTRLQPMRMFHLIYLLFFLMLGGLLGEHVLGSRPLRWVLLFAPLSVGMFALDRTMYPASPHLELPGRSTSNPWLQAFQWIRANTPPSAVFAVDPQYTAIPGEDTHGFRAETERSVLADAIKDSGAVTMFPQLLRDWQEQQDAQRGWRNFAADDFARLSRTTPVTWVVVQPSQDAGLPCPYRNAAVAVCRIDRPNGYAVPPR